MWGFFSVCLFYVKILGGKAFKMNPIKPGVFRKQNNILDIITSSFMEKPLDKSNQWTLSANFIFHFLNNK